MKYKMLKPLFLTKDIKYCRFMVIQTKMFKLWL